MANVLRVGVGISRPILVAASIQASAALCTSRKASSSVAPHAEQPGRSGMIAINPLSSLLQKISIGYFGIKLTIFVNHLNQLPPLIRRNIAVAVLEIKNYRLTFSAKSSMRAFTTYMIESKLLGYFAGILKSYSRGIIAYECKEFFAVWSSVTESLLVGLLHSVLAIRKKDCRGQILRFFSSVRRSAPYRLILQQPVFNKRRNHCSRMS